MRKKIWRIAAVLIASVLLMSSCLLAVSADMEGTMSRSDAAQENSVVRTVKVGFFSYPGYHEIAEDGTYRGYGVEFLTLLQRYANLNYEYVGYDKSWAEMLDMLQRISAVCQVAPACRAVASASSNSASLRAGSGSILAKAWSASARWGKSPTARHRGRASWPHARPWA